MVPAVSGHIDEKVRLQNIDVLRGIGIILMIMGHVYFCNMFDKFIHAFHMPLFFILSGYVTDSKRMSEIDPKTYIASLSKKLLIPYLFFSTFHLFIKIIVNPTAPILYHLKCIFIMNSGGIPIAEALWFLTAFYFAKILQYVIEKFIDKSSYKIIVVTFLFVLGCFSGQLPWSFGASLTGLGFIFAGYALKGLNLPNYKLCVKNIVLALIVGAITTKLIFFNEYVNMRMGLYSIIPISFINAVVATGIGIVVCSWISDKTRVFSSVLSTIGMCSIVFLCLNQLVIWIVNNVFEAWIPDNVVENLLLKVLITVLVIVILYVISLVIYKTPLLSLVGKAKIKPVIAVSMLFLILSVSVYGVNRHNNGMEVQRIADNVSQLQFSITDKPDLLSQNSLEYISGKWWIEPRQYSFSFDTDKRSCNGHLTVFQKHLVRKSQRSFIDWENETYLYLAGTTGIHENCENAVRPLAHNCLSLALLANTPVGTQKIKDMARILAVSLAKNHISNNPDGWGLTWQSALWAENTGLAAWIVWNDLSAEDKCRIVNMIITESDARLRACVPYYAENGQIRYEGDSKGEENAWNARILALASQMFPASEKTIQYEEKMKELLVSATAVREDNLKGYNLNSDGTVMNHSRIHIDYAACIVEGMSEIALIYRLNNKDVPPESLRNIDLIYHALVNLDLKKYNYEMEGHHFYERDINGDASANVAMPSANDWGGMWYPCYYLTDVVADIYGLDSTCPSRLKAGNFAKLHYNRALQMEERQNDSLEFIFCDGENNFVSGEEYMIHCLVKSYVLSAL